MKIGERVDYRLVYFLLYSVLSFLLTIYHEPFKNEAQAWLIVRDLDLPGIINIMWYEGTPALWHIILYPFVKLGFPYITMQIIHWIFALAIAWLIIYKAPFPLIYRILLVFSYFFLYEYCVMARNYNITILLIFLLALIWKNKHDYPLLFCVLVVLLINSNLIVFGFGLAVSILYLVDYIKVKKQYRLTFWISLLILTAGFLLVLFQIIPRAAANQHSVVTFNFWNIKFPDMLFRAPANAMISVGGDPESMVIPFFFFICTIAVMLLLIKNIPVFIAAIVSTGWCLYMFMFIYLGSTRHHGFLLIIFVFFFWIINYYRPSRHIKKIIPNYILSRIYLNSVLLIILISLITTVFRTLAIFPQEIRYEFSGSREIANYIKDNDLQDLIWVGYQEEKCEAILPYFPNKKFWYAGIQEWGSYVVWDQKFKDNHNLSGQQVIDRVKKQFHNSSDILLVLNQQLENPLAQGCRLIYKNKKKVFWIQDELFYLYRLIE